MSCIPVPNSSFYPGGRRGPSWCGNEEPSLHEVFADPVIHAVMRRDGVTQCALRGVVARAQAMQGQRSCPCRAA